MKLTLNFPSWNRFSVHLGAMICIQLAWSALLPESVSGWQPPPRQVNAPVTGMQRLPQNPGYLPVLNRPGDTGSVSTSHRPAQQNRIPFAQRSRTTVSLSDSMVNQVSANRTVNPEFEYPWTYQLKHLGYAEFEQKMAAIWGDRLQGQALDDEQRTLRIFLPEGRTAPEASMKFDRLDGLVTYEGAPVRKRGWHLLMQLLDRPQVRSGSRAAEVIDLERADGDFIRKVAYIYQQPATRQDDEPFTQEIPNAERLSQQDIDNLQLPPLQGTVQISVNPDTNSLVVTGSREDVEKVSTYIRMLIAESAAGMGKEIRRISLFNAQPTQLAETLREIYAEQFEALNGPARIDPNPGNKALIVVGSEGAVMAVEKLARQFDGPKPDATLPPDLPEEEQGFRTYRLKHISASNAKRIIDEFFGQSTTAQLNQPAEPLPVTVIVEERTNSVTVSASPDLQRRVAALIAEIDIVNSTEQGAKRIVRVFAIQNQIAGDLAVILQDILNGGQQQNPGLSESQIQAQQAVNQNQLGAGSTDPQTPLTTLEIRNRAGELTSGGILFDARITSNNASNTIAVVAPEDAMGLIAELVAQLDRLPAAFSEVKVFPVINGDATEILATLESIFTGGQQGGQQGGLQGQGNLSDLPLQSSPDAVGSTLLNLRFAVNERTNTIIASGSKTDLEFVEALIARLDEENIYERQTGVYRLSNASVADVAEALNAWLDERETINSANPLAGGGQFGGQVSLARRDVIVVEEVTSNSLIVNANPEYFPEIETIIYALDRRPPMVKVKALIVAVDLNQLENFGVEFGVQDSSIFQAGLSNFIGTGFVGPDQVAGQLVSDLGVGRSSSNAPGVSGLLLAAGSESLNFVLRSLKQKGCADVLFSPEIMTLENLTGIVNVGAEIQRVGGTVLNANNAVQNIENVETGITLAITPRVSPDGMIVMFVDVSNRELGSPADGTVIGTDAMGNEIISQPINQVRASTTIMARSGQTVVISGLFDETKSQRINSVPILGDLPVVGPIFRSVENLANRSELLFILTPYIVDGPDDLNAMNEDDFSRMHWCKCDVAEIYGETSFAGTGFVERTPTVYYPDYDPLGANPELSTQPPADNRQVPGYQESGIRNELQLPDRTNVPEGRWRNGQAEPGGNNQSVPQLDDRSRAPDPFYQPPTDRGSYRAPSNLPPVVRRRSETDYPSRSATGVRDENFAYPQQAANLPPYGTSTPSESAFYQPRHPNEAMESRVPPPDLRNADVRPRPITDCIRRATP